MNTNPKGEHAELLLKAFLREGLLTEAAVRTVQGYSVMRLSSTARGEALLGAHARASGADTADVRRDVVGAEHGHRVDVLARVVDHLEGRVFLQQRPCRGTVRCPST
jgi:hypothetical protein